MTKLEEKLLELGYVKHELCGKCYIKRNQEACIDIWLNDDLKSIKYESCGVQTNYLKKIKTDTQLKSLKKAFNQLQKDLEVLREYA